MQLLRLELRGFKSFADKTIVKFSPGMTAIVGPNGSGKSNITDAMRWVLGESNVRNLRGQRSEDVIFAGTEKRKPLSTAEVTLVFDNSDGQLPVERAEVAVTRRLYRTGESEFFINKQACRLKDIHLLLADTGLGKDSMAIIGQNRVDAILNSKPEERRLIFEEVAGIARFKLNKEEALRRIGTTTRNMERVADLMANLSEQTESLAEKAEATREYNRLSRERRTYEAVLTLHEYRTADRLFTRQENDKLALEAEDVELQTAEATTGAEEQRLQLALTEQRSALRTCEEDYAKAQRREAECEGDVRMLREQMRTMEKEAADKKSRLDELDASREADSQQVQLLEKLMADEEAELVLLRAKEREAESDYTSATAALTAGQASFMEAQQKERTRREQEMALIAKAESYRSDVTAAEDEYRRLTESLGRLETEIEEARRDTASIREGYEQLTTQLTEAEADGQRCRERQSECQQTMRRLEKEQRQNRQRLEQDKGRRELLSQWAEQYEGYSEGTRNVLKATLPWRKAVAGAVAELFTVDDTYATAIEIALGGSVNHVVTTTSQVASQAVAYLKEIQGGRVTFLPLEAVKGRRLTSPALEEPHVQGLAVDCIKFDNRYEGIFSQLLGRVIVVDTLEHAIELQKKYQHRLSVVTLGGEQLQPGGSLTGGAVKRRKATVMARKREAQQLDERIAVTEHRLEVAKAEMAACETALSETDTALEVATERYRDLHLQQASREATLTVAKERLERKERVYHDETVRRRELETRRVQLTQALQDAEQQRTALYSEGESAEDEAERVKELGRLQEAQQKAYEVLSQAKLAVMQGDNAQDERRRTIHEKKGAIASYELRRQPLYTAWQEANEAMQHRLPQALSEAETALKECRATIQTMVSGKDALYGRIKECEQAVNELRERRQGNENRLRQVQRRLGDMREQLAKYEVQKEQALEKLDALGFTREEAQALRVDGAVADWKTAHIALSTAIEALGAVNPNAIEEYEEAKNKLAFYEAQQNDLTEAKAQLETVIEEIDKAMTEQLLQVLDIVGERFQSIFSQLFGGGQAQIVVTDREHILTGGIDFYIQPPGKKRQQLSLLSGGERALTVIALLFSFLDYRPAPFCVLDEVDAALDEANVERFGRYLKTLGEDTQFIVVSHRKRTMEAAHVLQGVTMVERGVSRLLTVTLEDVKEDM